jgi:hypothetical protein
LCICSALRARCVKPPRFLRNLRQGWWVEV